MAVATGANAKIALAYESTFGTSPASGYFQLPFITFAHGQSQNLLEDDTIVVDRDPQRPGRGVIDASGTTRVPLDFRGIGYWLKLFMGDPVTTGSDPFTHVFSSGAASLPSASIEQQHPDVPAFFLHNGVQANAWTLQIQAEGLVEMSINLIGSASPSSGTTGAGTPSVITPVRFNQFQGTIDRDSSPLGKVLRATLPFTNNIAVSRYVNDAGAVGDIDPGRTAANGEVTVRFDDLTLFAAAEAVTALELDLTWTISVGASSINFNLPQIDLGNAPAPIEGPGGVQATFPYQASRTAGEQMLDVTLINDIASY
ncbi:MAG: phage tail tube protein [Geminicoccaceae bacterium]